MNKTNIDRMASLSQAQPKISLQIQIDFADVETLGEFWNRRRLTGFHWRLYHHSAKGAGLIHGDGRKLEMLPDFIYLLPPSKELGSYVESGCRPEQIFIHFSLDGCFLHASEDAYAIPFDANMESALKKLRDELQMRGNTPVSQLYANVAVALALAARPEILDRALSDSRINDVCRLMKESPSRQWSNEEFARRFGFATNAFIRRFKEVVGIPPYKYLQSVRYALGAKLLETTDLTIDEIAGCVGVNDKFHFSREFKKLHERSPSAHRKQLVAANRAI